MAKRRLILAVILGMALLGPMIDSASADQRIRRRQLVPSYLEGDPEWPDGTIPAATATDGSVATTPRTTVQPTSPVRWYFRWLSEAFAWLIGR